MKKFYLVKGVAYTLSDRSDLSREVNSFVGYFSNLKKVYENFDQSSVHSYSTIAKRIQKKGFYRAKECKAYTESQTLQFDQVLIKVIELNKIKFKSGLIDLTELISQEFSDFKHF